MKKILLLVPLFISGCMGHHHEVRKIEVSGTAEKEVTPDIVNISISLKEYKADGKKITITELENKLVDAVQKAGIPKSDFTVSDVSSWNDYWERKKNPTFLASKQYNLRVHDLNKFNSMLSSIDARGVESTEVSSYDFSKMADLKKELKVQALLAAKDKAGYLLSAFNEKPGKILDINETGDKSNPSQYENRMIVDGYAAEYNAAPNIRTSTIKLKFTVQATFEIAD